jgi:hypothetical protein
MCARLRASWLGRGIFLELLFARCHFGAQFYEPTLTEECFGVGKHLVFLVLDVMLDVLHENFDLHVVGFVGRRDTCDLPEQTSIRVLRQGSAIQFAPRLRLRRQGSISYSPLKLSLSTSEEYEATEKDKIYGSVENQLALALMTHRKLESIARMVTKRKNQQSANFDDVGRISTYINER